MCALALVCELGCGGRQAGSMRAGSGGGPGGTGGLPSSNAGGSGSGGNRSGAGGRESPGGSSGSGGIGGGNGVGGSGVAVNTNPYLLVFPSGRLDLLLVVDDALGMKPLQAKFAAQLPGFLAQIVGLLGGLPDLHVAVISSSLGAGAYGDVPSCMPNSPGDGAGRFQHKAGCGLNAGETFLKVPLDGSPRNFSGNPGDVLTCLAQLGDDGCSVGSQLGAMRAALIKAADPNDPDSGGFLRDGALLSVVMLTRRDDCSLPDDSQLFNTSVTSVTDQPPLGGMSPYRCNEFGHRCDQPLPHTAAGLPMFLTGCTSKENTDGLYHLIPVADFVSFLAPLKDLDRLHLAVIAGQPEPYRVQTRTAVLPNNLSELQPEIAHSCVAADGTYGDPAVRLSKLAADVGGLFLPVCATNFTNVTMAIASALAKRLQPGCVDWNVSVDPRTARPDCSVVLTTVSVTGSHKTTLPYCAADHSNATLDVPCWQLTTNPTCPKGKVMQVCSDPSCGPPPSTVVNLIVSLTCTVTQ